MVKDSPLLDPYTHYERVLKTTHQKNIKDFFDDLVKRSGVDVEANALTTKEINKFQNACDILGQRKGKYRAWRTFLIVIAIISLVVGLLFLLDYIYTPGDGVAAYISLIVAIVLLVVALTSTLIIFLKLNKVIKNLAKEIKDHEAKLHDLKALGYQQLSALNRLYDFGMSAEIVRKTTPLIQLDNYFDNKKWEYLHNHYQFEENNDLDSSISFILSGSIVGNPFLIKRTRLKEIKNHIYTGSMVVTYTTHVTDSEGHSRLVTKTQTLTASITRPKPEYRSHTCLLYANDAAPNLRFSRSPMLSRDLSEKDIKKLVKNGVKEIDRLHTEAVNKGESFTPLGNDEFDYLFNALDRNHETQFRLLFTPLAQSNILELIKSKEPYGDDFEFVKANKINYICSAHSYSFTYEDEPERFINYSIEEAFKSFNEYQTNFFTSLYFDLAPILSIPLYQQHKPFEYIYEHPPITNYPQYEHEALANRFNNQTLRHKDSATEAILKTSFIKKDEDFDRVNITAYSYRGVPRIEYVPRTAGDGKTHLVPVPWVEYLPLEKNTIMEVKASTLPRQRLIDKLSDDNVLNVFKKYCEDDLGITYKPGLFGFLVNDPTMDLNNDEVAKLLDK